MGSLNDFKSVMEYIFSGRLDPVIDSVYPLEAAPEAYAHYERGEQFGKIVIRVRGE